VNLEKGSDGPEIYREYAFNGLFARDDYVRDHPEIAHKVVDSVVEAEQLINDPSRIADVTRVAMNHMHGISKELLTDYITSYRAIFEPVASHQAIDNVNQSLQFAGQLKTPIPYKEVVDTAYMPTSFPEKK
jgi:ABC-type nitrate/sulfonate/bicarbonate transport system substrate-binding protein